MRESTFTLLLWLFFTDSLSHISRHSLSTMRRTHPIHGPLVSGKSFFHHSSFLLNWRILGETNWIFSTPVLTSVFYFLSWRQHLDSCFNFRILITVLTTASHLLLGLQHFYSCPDNSILIPALSFTTGFFSLQLTAQGFSLSQAVIKTFKVKTINIFINSFVFPFNITRGNRTLQLQLLFCINGCIICPIVINTSSANRKI